MQLMITLLRVGVLQRFLHFYSDAVDVGSGSLALEPRAGSCPM